MRRGSTWGTNLSSKRGVRAGFLRIDCPDHSGRIVGVWARALGHGVWVARPRWWEL